MAGVPNSDTITPYTCTYGSSIHSVVERAIFHYGNIVINRLDTIRHDLMSDLSSSQIRWFTFVVVIHSQFLGLLYRFYVSVRTLSESFSLIPWTLFKSRQVFSHITS